MEHYEAAVLLPVGTPATDDVSEWLAFQWGLQEIMAEKCGFDGSYWGHH